LLEDFCQFVAIKTEYSFWFPSKALDYDASIEVKIKVVQPCTINYRPGGGGIFVNDREMREFSFLGHMASVQ